MPGQNREVIAGFAKGLRVIEAFGAQRQRLTITEAAASCGLERATARRCLLTLVENGYAQFDGKYFWLTPKVLRLGFAYLASTPLPHLIQPFLEKLSHETGESCSAAILDDTEIVYVARASHRRVMSIGLNVGSRLPAYCSSMGRVLLASLPERERKSLLERTRLVRHTPRTLVTLDELLDEIGRVAKQGYAIVDQELELGLRSIGVPLADSGGRVIAALNIGAHAERASPDRMTIEFLPRMRAIQQDVSRVLG